MSGARGHQPSPPARQDPPLPETVHDLEQRADRYFRSARSPNTVKAYRYDLEHFATWCKVEAGGLSPFPAEPRTVSLYITDLAGRGADGGKEFKASTLQRRLAAIAQLHQEAGLEDPTKTKAVRNTYRGIVREIGTFQEGKAPMVGATVRRVLAAFKGDEGAAAARDRVILLVGLAGGYRTSELGSLMVEDVEFVDEGAILLLRRSKTDQVGGGFYKGIKHGTHPETCPVTHLRRWLAHLTAAGRASEGPLLCAVGRYGNLRGGGMTRESISRVVTKRAEAAGLDPGRYSGHSLRAGHVTAASAGGASDKAIMDQTGHKASPP
jgi:site-specific recombinase XerD